MNKERDRLEALATAVKRARRFGSIESVSAVKVDSFDLSKVSKKFKPQSGNTGNDALRKLENVGFAVTN